MRSGIFLDNLYGGLYAEPTAEQEAFSEKTGVTAEGKIALGIYLAPFFLTFGGGFFIYSVAGGEAVTDASDKQVKNEDGSLQLEERRIFALNTLVEISSSLELGQNFLTGVVFQLRNPSDLGYSSEVFRDKTATAYGGQIGFHRKGESAHHRVLVKFMRTTNNVGWKDYQTSVGYQFGIPLSYTSPVGK
jgi:hypothetical protein